MIAGVQRKCIYPGVGVLPEKLGGGCAVRFLKPLRPIRTRGFAPGACSRVNLHD